MSDGTQIDDGRRLFAWSMAKRRSPHNELVDEIIASGAKLYNLNGKLVAPNKERVRPLRLTSRTCNLSLPKTSRPKSG